MLFTADSQRGWTMRIMSAHVFPTLQLMLLSILLAKVNVIVASRGIQREMLVFEDNFKDFDLSVWKHDITMAGGGNWEFEVCRCIGTKTCGMDHFL